MKGSLRSIVGGGIAMAMLLTWPSGAVGHHKDGHADRGPGTTEVSSSPDFGFNYNPLPQDQPGTGERFLSGATVAPLQAAIKPGSIHRFGIRWDEVERQPDTYFFDSIDQRIGPLADAGLRLLPVILGAHPSRRDLIENLFCPTVDCVMPPADTPAGLGAWEELVLRIVNHFSTGRYEGTLAGVEVWNEANWTRYWQTLTGPDPARLARLACRADKAVARSLSPDVPIGVGGLIPWDDVNPPPTDLLNRNIPLREYLNGMYATQDAEVSDVRECMDAVSFHPYLIGHPPDDPDLLFLRSINNLRNIFEENDDVGRAIWITETGQGVGEGIGLVPDEQTQADMIECAYRRVAQEDDIKIYLQHTLVDFGEGGAFAGAGAYGIDENDNIVPRVYRDRLAALFSQYGDSVPAIQSCSEI